MYNGNHHEGGGSSAPKRPNDKAEAKPAAPAKEKQDKPKASQPAK